MKINGNYSDLWKAIIRPDKNQYADLGKLSRINKNIGYCLLEIGERKFIRQDL